jgi:hypothetical protein
VAPTVPKTNASDKPPAEVLPIPGEVNRRNRTRSNKG